MRRTTAWPILALLLAGCLWGGPPEGPSPPREPVRVDPPQDGGGWAPCASRSALQLAIPFSSESFGNASGFEPGLHRVDRATFVWVWARHVDTQRQDEVRRVNDVHAFREPDGRLVLCTRVDLAAPVEVDGERRTYDVAVRFKAHSRLPDAPLRFVVNWTAGCGPCGGPRSGNATAEYAPSG